MTAISDADAQASRPSFAGGVGQRSVRTFLIWLVLACLLPGIAGAVLLFAREYRESRAQLGKDTLQTARALLQAVDNQMLRVQGIAQGLATASSLETGDFATFHRRAREALEQSGLGADVVLTDAAGREIVNTARSFGTRLPDYDYPEMVRQVFRTGRPAVSNLYTSRALQRSVAAVGVPVFLHGRVAYCINVAILPRVFDDTLAAQRLPPGWIASILDGAGTFVARTQASDELRGKTVPQAFLRAIMESPEGTLDAVATEGTPVFSVFSRSPLTGWRVAIGIPHDAIQASLWQTLLVLLLGVVSLFGAGIGFAWLVAWRIGRSFQALVAPAIALGSGGKVAIPRTEVKEADEVARAIGRAAELLRQRTDALRKSEERYRTLFDRMAEGFAVGELIYDAQGRPVDQRLLEANDAFFGETGLARNILNRPSREVLPVIEQYWLDALHEVVVRGGSVHLQDYSAATLRYYDARAYRPGAGRFAIVLRDITAAKRTERELQESRFTLMLALKAGGSAAWEMDVATERIVASDAAVFGMLGFTPAELPTRTEWIWRTHDEDRQELEDMIDDVVAGRKEGYSMELRLRAKDGSWRWILSQGVAAERDAQGRALRLVGTHTDVTERKEMQQRVRDAALHDPLTGLPNRALTFEYGGHLIAAARRSHGRGALLFIDLDRFKPINDLYGHETGDRVLQEAARRLRQCTRQEDLVGRLGGDEFVIILPHLDDVQHRAAVVAQHVIASISQPFHIGSLELLVSPSIGIAYFPEHADHISGLLHSADLAMYRVKQSGRASYQFYTPELDRKANEALTLESRLKHALKHRGLHLHYQPVMDMRSGAMIGAEALVRMADSDAGVGVGPQRFIPIAEATGLIGELGEWVAGEACRQHAAWLKQGLDVVIAINVSPLQFRQKAFAERLGRIAADYGVEPAGLQIEVTESAIMENVDEAVLVLQQLKDHGMKIALDDFGTGYSSLGSLSRLPIDKLKVDQSFVRHIADDPRSRAIARAVIALGRALHLEIVGEGIESAETLGYLRREGCDQAQGYFFSRPLPAEEFACWYRGHIMH
jgi:diguanylate cyclase (GGDEF)-like protein/PAS domain S-box-containing protein